MASLGSVNFEIGTTVNDKALTELESRLRGLSSLYSVNVKANIDIDGLDTLSYAAKEINKTKDEVSAAVNEISKGFSKYLRDDIIKFNESLKLVGDGVDLKDNVKDIDKQLTALSDKYIETFVRMRDLVKKVYGKAEPPSFLNIDPAMLNAMTSEVIPFVKQQLEALNHATEEEAKEIRKNFINLFDSIGFKDMFGIENMENGFASMVNHLEGSVHKISRLYKKLDIPFPEIGLDFEKQEKFLTGKTLVFDKMFVRDIGMMEAMGKLRQRANEYFVKNPIFLKFSISEKYVDGTKTALDGVAGKFAETMSKNINDAKDSLKSIPEALRASLDEIQKIVEKVQTDITDKVFEVTPRKKRSTKTTSDTADGDSVQEPRRRGRPRKNPVAEEGSEDGSVEEVVESALQKYIKTISNEKGYRDTKELNRLKKESKDAFNEATAGYDVNSNSARRDALYGFDGTKEDQRKGGAYDYISRLEDAKKKWTEIKNLSNGNDIVSGEADRKITEIDNLIGDFKELIVDSVESKNVGSKIYLKKFNTKQEDYPSGRTDSAEEYIYDADKLLSITKEAAESGAFNTEQVADGVSETVKDVIEEVVEKVVDGASDGAKEASEKQAEDAGKEVKKEVGDAVEKIVKGASEGAKGAASDIFGGKYDSAGLHKKIVGFKNDDLESLESLINDVLSGGLKGSLREALDEIYKSSKDATTKSRATRHLQSLGKIPTDINDLEASSGWIDKIAEINSFIDKAGGINAIEHHTTGGEAGGAQYRIEAALVNLYASKINGAAHSVGGPVYGPGTKTSDSIPAMLSNGEYIVNAFSTDVFRPILNLMNGVKGGVTETKELESALVGLSNAHPEVKAFSDSLNALQCGAVLGVEQFEALEKALLGLFGSVDKGAHVVDEETGGTVLLNVSKQRNRAKQIAEAVDKRYRKYSDDTVSAFESAIDVHESDMDLTGKSKDFKQFASLASGQIHFGYIGEEYSRGRIVDDKGKNYAPTHILEHLKQKAASVNKELLDILENTIPSRADVEKAGGDVSSYDELIEKTKGVITYLSGASASIDLAINDDGSITNSKEGKRGLQARIMNAVMSAMEIIEVKDELSDINSFGAIERHSGGGNAGVDEEKYRHGFGYAKDMFERIVRSVLPADLAEKAIANVSKRMQSGAMNKMMLSHTLAGLGVSKAQPNALLDALNSEENKSKQREADKVADELRRKAEEESAAKIAAEKAEANRKAEAARKHAEELENLRKKASGLVGVKGSFSRATLTEEGAVSQIDAALKADRSLKNGSQVNLNNSHSAIKNLISSIGAAYAFGGENKGTEEAAEYIRISKMVSSMKASDFMGSKNGESEEKLKTALDYIKTMFLGMEGVSDSVTEKLANIGGFKKATEAAKEETEAVKEVVEAKKEEAAAEEKVEEAKKKTVEASKEEGKEEKKTTGARRTVTARSDDSIRETGGKKKGSSGSSKTSVSDEIADETALVRAIGTLKGLLHQIDKKGGESTAEVRKEIETLVNSLEKARGNATETSKVLETLPLKVADMRNKTSESLTDVTLSEKDSKHRYKELVSNIKRTIENTKKKSVSMAEAGYGTADIDDEIAKLGWYLKLVRDTNGTDLGKRILEHSDAYMRNREMSIRNAAENSRRAGIIPFVDDVDEGENVAEKFEHSLQRVIRAKEILEKKNPGATDAIKEYTDLIAKMQEVKDSGMTGQMERFLDVPLELDEDGNIIAKNYKEWMDVARHEERKAVIDGKNVPPVTPTPPARGGGPSDNDLDKMKTDLQELKHLKEMVEADQAHGNLLGDGAKNAKKDLDDLVSEMQKIVDAEDAVKASDFYGSRKGNSWKREKREIRNAFGLEGKESSLGKYSDSQLDRLDAYEAKLISLRKKWDKETITSSHGTDTVYVKNDKAIAILDERLRKVRELRDLEAEERDIAIKRAFARKDADGGLGYSEAERIEGDERKAARAEAARLQKIRENAERGKGTSTGTAEAEAERKRKKAEKEREEAERKAKKAADEHAAARQRLTELISSCSAAIEVLSSKIASAEGDEKKELEGRIQRLYDIQTQLSGKDELGKEEFKTFRDAIQDASGLKKETKSVDEQLQELAKHAGGLQGLFGNIFSVYTIKRFCEQLIQIGGEFEKQHVALRSMLGDAAKADELFSKTKQLAIESPFTFQELNSFTKQLTAYSIPYEELFDTTKRLSDISAGLGVDMSRIILAYGQVRSAEFLRGQELRQFTEAGIPLLDKLAKKFAALEGRAVSVGEVFKRISKRQVDFGMVKDIIWEMTDEGGTFYNMQSELTDTLSGSATKMKDSWQIALSEISEMFNGTARTIIGWITSLINSWKKFAWLVTGIAVTATFRAMGGAVAALILYVQNLKKAIFAAGMAGKIALGANVIGAVLGIVSAIGIAIKQFNAFNNKMDEIHNEAESNIASEVTNLNILVAKIKNANEGTMERKELIQKLNERYGDYLDHIVSEAEGYDEIAAAASRATEQIIRKYRAEELQKKEQAIYDDEKGRLDDARSQIVDNVKANVKQGGKSISDKQAKRIAATIENMIISGMKQDKLSEILNDAFGVTIATLTSSRTYGFGEDARLVDINGVEKYYKVLGDIQERQEELLGDDNFDGFNVAWNDAKKTVIEMYKGDGGLISQETTRLGQLEKEREMYQTIYNLAIGIADPNAPNAGKVRTALATYTSANQINPLTNPDAWYNGAGVFNTPKPFSFKAAGDAAQQSIDEIGRRLDQEYARRSIEIFTPSWNGESIRLDYNDLVAESTDQLADMHSYFVELAENAERLENDNKNLDKILKGTIGSNDTKNVETTKGDNTDRYNRIVEYFSSFGLDYHDFLKSKDKKEGKEEDPLLKRLRERYKWFKEVQDTYKNGISNGMGSDASWNRTKTEFDAFGKLGLDATLSYEQFIEKIQEFRNLIYASTHGKKADEYTSLGLDVDNWAGALKMSYSKEQVEKGLSEYNRWIEEIIRRWDFVKAATELGSKFSDELGRVFGDMTIDGSSNVVEWLEGQLSKETDVDWKTLVGINENDLFDAVFGADKTETTQEDLLKLGRIKNIVSQLDSATKNEESERQNHYKQMLETTSDYELKRLAIILKYSNLRKQALTEEQKKMLQIQAGEELTNLELERSGIFVNTSTYSKSQKRAVRDANKARLKVIDEYGKAYSKNGILAGFQVGDVMYTLDTIEKLENTVESLGNTTDKVADSFKNLWKWATGGKKREQKIDFSGIYEGLSTSIDEIGKIGNSVASIFSGSGSKDADRVGLIFNSLSGLTTAIGKFAEEDYVGGVEASVSTIASIIEDGRKRDEEERARRDEVRNKKLDALKGAISNLSDAIDKSYDISNLSLFADKGRGFAEEYIDKKRDEMKDEADWSNGSHHSITHSLDDKLLDSDWTKINQAFALAGIDKTISNASQLWDLTPEEWKAIMTFAPTQYGTISTERSKDRWDNSVGQYVDAMVEIYDSLDSFDDKLFQKMTGMSFDTVRSKFHDAMMDMSSDVDSFSDSFTEAMMSSIVDLFIFGDEFEAWLRDWHTRWTRIMSDKSLTEEERAQMLNGMKDEARDFVESKYDERDYWADILGYDGENSSSTKSSIQGVTEETADVLAAYINGMRGDLSVQSSDVHLIAHELMPEIISLLDTDGSVEAARALTRDYGAIDAEGVMEYASVIALNTASMSNALNALAYTQIPEISATTEAQLTQLEMIAENTLAMRNFSEVISDDLAQVRHDLHSVISAYGSNRLNV